MWTGHCSYLSLDPNDEEKQQETGQKHDLKHMWEMSTIFAALHSCLSKANMSFQVGISKVLLQN